MCHRDVRSENALLTAKAIVRLTDFGLCKDLTQALSGEDRFLGNAKLHAGRVRHAGAANVSMIRLFRAGVRHMRVGRTQAAVQGEQFEALRVPKPVRECGRVILG